MADVVVSEDIPTAISGNWLGSFVVWLDVVVNTVIPTRTTTTTSSMIIHSGTTAVVHRHFRGIIRGSEDVIIIICGGDS